MFDYCTVTPHGTFTRKSNRKYTHLVVCRKNGSVREVRYAGSTGLANQKAKLMKSYGYSEISVHPVGVKGGVGAWAKARESVSNGRTSRIGGTR